MYLARGKFENRVLQSCIPGQSIPREMERNNRDKHPLRSREKPRGDLATSLDLERSLRDVRAH